MKSLTYRIIAINGEIIDFLFRIKVNLFMDSSNFSTTFTLEIESEPENGCQVTIRIPKRKGRS